jgi:diamine N-acetyltransferase
LRVVDDDNVDSVIDLAVSTDQESFVAPNIRSLAQAFATTRVWVRAVYADNTPVGFAMLSDDAEKPRYYLWRFMIDRRYQRMGFGKRAMDLVHEYVRTRPEGSRIYLSYVPADGGPGHFYKSIGYEDTGKVHGGEVEAVLALTP